MDFLIEHGPSENRRIMLVGGLLPRNLACEGGGNNSVVQQNPAEATADMPRWGLTEAFMGSLHTRAWPRA